MKKTRKDPVREDRIENEAIVDAGPDEQAAELVLLSGKQNQLPVPREVHRREGRLTAAER